MTEKAKFNLLYIFITLTTLPFLLLIHRPEAWTIITGSLFLSAFLGYAGISILLWMYILGTRSIAGLFFSDLPRVMKIHKVLGKYGVVLLFLHPLLVAYNYGENFITYTLLPNLSTSFEKHVSYGRVGFLTLLIIWITSAVIRDRIAFRPWKYIHYLAYLALPMSFLHVPRVGTSYPVRLIQFYWLSFIFIYLVISALRLRHVFGFSKSQYELIENKKVTDTVYVMHLKSLNNGLYVKPGQYVYLQIGLLHEEHPFTVMDFDNEKSEIWLAYKVFGNYTNKMSKLKTGDTVMLDGSYGIFTDDLNKNNNKTGVFIAGGIGITPFIKHIKTNPDNFTLFYANQTKSSAAFSSWLIKRLGDRYVGILSRENSPVLPGEERGHIDVDIVKRHLSEPLAYDYYICGSKGFVKTATESLNIIGVPKKQIHIEEFDF